MSPLILTDEFTRINLFPHHFHILYYKVEWHGREKVTLLFDRFFSVVVLKQFCICYLFTFSSEISTGWKYNISKVSHRWNIFKCYFETNFICILIYFQIYRIAAIIFFILLFLHTIDSLVIVRNTLIKFLQVK